MSAKSRILACPLDGLDPFSYTLKLINGSEQNFMDPFTRQGMPKSFVIVNTKKNVNEQIMTQKTKKFSSGGHNIQNFGPLKFSLDSLNLGFAVLKGSKKISWGPLNF